LDFERIYWKVEVAMLGLRVQSKNAMDEMSRLGCASAEDKISRLRCQR
jgi:hypothetical protein